MHSRLLVSGLPRSLPPLLPSLVSPCLPCVEGRQRAAPHSSSFPPTTAPLRTLHMDVWGPAHVSGQGRERYFLPVVDDYAHYTTVFPFLDKGEDLPVLRLHSDRGGEFSSNLLREFCCGEGILQSFTLPASPQQNGIAERRIGLVMEDVTFDESVPFYRLFLYRSTPPPPPPPPLFLAPGPPRVDPLPPQGPAPSRVSQIEPLPGTVPVEVAVGSGAARGAASGGAASAGAEPGGAESEGAGSGGAEPEGAEPGGAEPAGVEPGGAEPEGVEPGRAESEGAESWGAEPRGTASSGGPAGVSPRLSPRPEPLSSQQLREWFSQRTRLRSGAAGAGDSAAGDTGVGVVGVVRFGGAGVTAGAGGTGGVAAAGPGGARTRAGGTGAGGAGAGGAGAGDIGAVGARDGGTGTGGAGAGGAGAGDTGAVDPGAGGARAEGVVSGGSSAGGTFQPRPYFDPLLQQVLASLPTTSCFSLHEGLTEHREPESCPASPVRTVHTGRRVPRPRPPPVPGTHAVVLCPSFVPLHVPLPSPPKSSLLAVPDPESGLSRTASPTVSHLLATVVTDPSFESTAASALVA
ncbi:unnamed protein product [Closterium sp. NIES-53]